MRISLDKEDPGYYGRTGESPDKWACYLDDVRVSAVTADEEQGYALIILHDEHGRPRFENRQPVVESRHGRVRLVRLRP